MLLFGFGAMNGFWGANVVWLASNGGALDAVPWKSGSDGGGTGTERIGSTGPIVGSAAAPAGSTTAMVSVQIAPRRTFPGTLRLIGASLHPPIRPCAGSCSGGHASPPDA